MPLTCRKAVVLFAVAFVACHESTTPGTVSAGFRLNDINGRALPTYQAPTPGITVTVLGGSLTLEPTGLATMIEEREQPDGTPFVLAGYYTYRINGNDLSFTRSTPCPIEFDCLPTPHGTISPVTGALALEVGQFGTTPIVYNFARVILD